MIKLSSTTKTLATGLGAVALSLGGLALSTNNAQAAVLTFQSATLSDNGTISGSFDFTSGVVSAVNIITTPGNNTGITTTALYTSGTLSNPSQVNFTNASGSTLQILLNNSATFAQIASGTIPQANISPSLSPFFLPSNEFRVSATGTQIRGVAGGVVTAVPEPLTMLGAATAVGFGAAFKRRALKKSKKD